MNGQRERRVIPFIITLLALLEIWILFFRSFLLFYILSKLVTCLNFYYFRLHCLKLQASEP